MMRSSVYIMCAALLFTQIPLVELKASSCSSGWTLKNADFCEMIIPAWVSEPFDDYCAKLLSIHFSVAGEEICRRAAFKVMSHKGNGIGGGGLPPPI